MAGFLSSACAHRRINFDANFLIFACTMRSYLQVRSPDFNPVCNFKTGLGGALAI